MADIRVRPDGFLSFGNDRYRCALGRGGVSDAKREGDGATPVGCFALRRGLWRPDRLERPATALSLEPIGEQDGWCDDPAHPDYNRPVRLPFGASCEKMYRDDHLYDIVVILGHNDDPPVPGAGSAIFLHVAKPGYAATEGCVALDLDDLLTLLARIGPGDRLCVDGPPAKPVP